MIFKIPINLKTVNQNIFTVFSLSKKWKGELMEEEKREIKELPHKQLIMDIGKTKHTVSIHFKQNIGETYKDKILKLIRRDTEKI